jgi:hypothetical protein
VNRSALVALVLGIAATADATPTYVSLYITDAYPFGENDFSSAPWVGTRTLYLTLDMAYYTNHIEFDLESTFDAASLETVGPWHNEGTANHVVLRRDECLLGIETEVMAEIIVEDVTGSGGRICFLPSATWGEVAAEYCDPSQGWEAATAIGFTSDGGEFCIVSGPVSVSPGSWGRVKAE